MKNYLICCIALAFIVSCAKAPGPVYPIPSRQQVAWHKLETYAFVHFGLNTFNDMEWGYGDTPASTFNPTDLDCEQWAATLKACGMKAVILTAKHHDGFCLWPTKSTDYNISKSLYKDGKGDMVGELSAACKKHGLKFGIYLSPWDRNNAEYGRPAYVVTYHTQLEELTGNYGPLFEFWFDGANGGDGYYGGADETRSIDPDTYYDYERARDTVVERHPDAMIFGGTVPTIRWVGNEDGWAPTTNWCPDNYGKWDSLQWLPVEVDVSIRPGWFYHYSEDNKVKSVEKLCNIYYESVGRNSNLLLNFPVGLNGKIHPQDSLRAVEWHNAICNDLRDNVLKNAKVTADNERGCRFRCENVNDGDWGTYWATEDGYDGGSISFSFDKPVNVNRIVVQEYIPLGQRVMEFSVEGELDGEWFAIDCGEETTTIGYKRILRFNTVKLDKLVINFDESKASICINNIEAFYAEQSVCDD